MKYVARKGNVINVNYCYNENICLFFNQQNQQHSAMFAWSKR